MIAHGQNHATDPQLKHRILSLHEHAASDQAAIASGISLANLIDQAGRLVADTIRLRWSKRPVLVLAGPGHNGDDGRVAARYLRQAGWEVSEITLSSDPAQEFDRQAIAAEFNRAGLVVDALFGAGLNRPITPEESPQAAHLITMMQHQTTPRLAVDVPSGLHGDSGQVLGHGLGMAAQVTVTVTFCRLKPAHLLMPGRDLCGEIFCRDIGIKDNIFNCETFKHATQNIPRTYVNHPDLWRDALPHSRNDQHKYQRGQVLIRGGSMSGAARLAANAARRQGAGMVTIAVPMAKMGEYVQTEAGVILQPLAWGEWRHELTPPHLKRYAALLLGPGNAPDDATRLDVLAALATDKPVILDAGAITAFAGHSEMLRQAIKSRSPQAQNPILTPHAQEFQAIIPATIAASDDKLRKTREGAAWLGAVIIHKGRDSVIATPEGTAFINHNAPHSLATAGSGDVLAGLVAARLAAQMPAWAAAAASVFAHGLAAWRFDQVSATNLIAEDIAAHIYRDAG
ncbi:MAG: NAD(P)H-hydrate dehydratase [Candidatus Symbiobacter sp.]|nr:NAD(P)H-hydrate dehydratase [Candidatus Symbiobacter sp.]